MAEAPPPAVLALTPDHVEDVAVDLTGLEDVPWSQLSHAHGSAGDIPVLLRSLADRSADWDQTLDELLGDNLLHQGSYYSATAPAMPFLAKLITSGAVPAKRRLDLYVSLMMAADGWTDSLLHDADRAAAQNRLPRPAPWTQEVHLTVGEQLPEVLARWDSEPPAGRFMLACLAAMFPYHGRLIGDRIAATAGQLGGTRPGAYLRLAAALVEGDDDTTLAIATEIIGWEESHDTDWLDVANLTIPVRAGHILAEGALRLLGNTS